MANKKKRIGKVFTELLPVALKESEMVAQATRLGEALGEMDNLDQRLSKTKSEFKSLMEVQQTIINESSRIIRERKIMREVDCVKVIDTTANKVRFTRKDTGEVFKEEDISDDDLQVDITEETD